MPPPRPDVNYMFASVVREGVGGRPSRQIRDCRAIGVVWCVWCHPHEGRQLHLTTTSAGAQWNLASRIFSCPQFLGLQPSNHRPVASSGMLVSGDIRKRTPPTLI